jgi:dCMP deaminase
MPPVRFKSQTDADRYYLGQAQKIRALSDDPKAIVARQSAVGAVVADSSGMIAQSANVLPPRLKVALAEAGRSVSDVDRYFLIEHAERAALYKAWEAARDLKSATLYSTRFPCSDCARAIVWSRIERIVVPRGFAGEKRWLEAQRAALRMLRDSGIIIRYFGKTVSNDDGVYDNGKP